MRKESKIWTKKVISSTPLLKMEKAKSKSLYLGSTNLTTGEKRLCEDVNLQFNP